MFWERITFYEYIQDVIDKARTRPTAKQWQKAKIPFITIINNLDPDIIVCLGKELFNNLPEAGREGQTVKNNSGQMHTWVYNYTGKDCIVCSLPHPSSFGFQKKVWTKIYEKFYKDWAKNNDSCLTNAST
jgi:uracil-DNA glycosylase